ncbi:MAG TPA: filamentous hemagglutinin N-terminal domain-containing protein [Stellaceae bacterium]
MYLNQIGSTAMKAGRLSFAVTMTAAIALLALSGRADAAPTGGTVVAGGATITQSGAVTDIDQSTSKAIINWQGFSVAPQETVNFNQPAPSSVTLNRVVGNESSVIAGALNANGQVFIVNAAGVLFTRGAEVNVGGLVASTKDIADQDFMAGNYTFSGDSKASVVNRGRIKAAPGGYVALLGRAVANDGVIVAKLGTVAMAAGDKITLNFGGDSLVDVTIDQGTLNALVENKRAIIADGGRVIMTAAAANDVVAAQVNNSGIVQAQTIAALTGGDDGTVSIGTITLEASGGNVNAGGTLDVSSPNGGNAGNIKVLAQGGTASVTGKLNASAPKSGNGGKIETSGDHVQVADSAVIASAAANGSNGTWLLDPDGFTIAAAGGDITGAALGKALASNNVAIQSTGGSGTGGDIDINDVVTWAANTTLSLNATNAIDVNATITGSGAHSGLHMNAGTDINVNAPSSLQVNTIAAVAGQNVNINAAQAWANASTLSFTAGKDINVNDTVGWSAGTLALNAGGSVFVNAAMSATGTASFTANYGTGSNADGTPDGLYMAVNAPGGVPDGTFAGQLNFNSSGTLTIGGNVYTVVHSLAELIADTGADYAASGGFVNGGTIVGHYALGSDLDAAGTGYAASSTNSNQTSTNLDTLGYAVIGDLSGAINGLGHSIKNLAIYDTDGAVSAGNALADALVGSTESGSLISNLGVTNVNIVSSSQFHQGVLAAGIAGVSSGNITNVFVTGTIAGENDVGGIAGVNVGLIANAYTNLAITADQSDIGGLVGLNAGPILNSVSNGSVTVNALTIGTSVTLASDIGGLVGENFGTVDGSTSNANVTANNFFTDVGGLVGDNNFGGLITNSSATGTVRVTNTSPNLVQLSGQAGMGVGGLAGNNENGSTISNSTFSGKVIASTEGAPSGVTIGGVSGLVGNNDDSSSISNSVFTGSVTGLGSGTFGIGGVAGFNNGTITNSTALGSVTGGVAFVGAFVGADNGGSYSGDAFNPLTTGQANPVGGGGSFPGITAISAIDPSATEGAPPPPESPADEAADARAQGQSQTQKATAQQVSAARQAQQASQSQQFGSQSGNAVNTAFANTNTNFSSGENGRNGGDSGLLADIMSQISPAAGGNGQDGGQTDDSGSATIGNINVNGQNFNSGGGGGDNGNDDDSKKKSN